MNFASSLAPLQPVSLCSIILLRLLACAFLAATSRSLPPQLACAPSFTSTAPHKAIPTLYIFSLASAPSSIGHPSSDRRACFIDTAPQLFDGSQHHMVASYTLSSSLRRLSFSVFFFPVSVLVHCHPGSLQPKFAPCSTLLHSTSLLPLVELKLQPCRKTLSRIRLPLSSLARCGRNLVWRAAQPWAPLPAPTRSMLSRLGSSCRANDLVRNAKRGGNN